MKKKLILGMLILAMGMTFAACGKANPVIQETSMGVNLENKAKEQVDKQAEEMENADQMLDEIPEE